MSRFDYCDEGDIPAGLWKQAIVRALGSARGRAVLDDLEAALLALPAPRLIEGALCDEEGEVCAMGAYALRKLGLPRRFALESLQRQQDDDWWDEAGLWVTEMVGETLGLRRSLAWAIAYINDERRMIATPEERYQAVLSWIREARSDPAKAMEFYA